MREGDIAISLGTSDTVLSVLADLPPKPLPFGHVFPHPVLQDHYWCMLCYTNGDVTRRRVRDEFFAAGRGDGWDDFSKAIRETPLGNSGSVGLFFTTDEITPAISKGPDLRGRLAGGQSEIELVAAFEDQRQNARAVIEMRALSIRNHLNLVMPKLLEERASGADPGRLLLTGGASGNPDILQVFADVFQRPVRILDNTEGAAFGAAVRAMHAVGAQTAADLDRRLLSLSTVQAQPVRCGTAAGAVSRAAAALAELEGQALKLRGRLANAVT